jgi:hypothetical protein
VIVLDNLLVMLLLRNRRFGTEGGIGNEFQEQIASATSECGSALVSLDVFSQ